MWRSDFLPAWSHWEFSYLNNAYSGRAQVSPPHPWVVTAPGHVLEPTLTVTGERRPNWGKLPHILKWIPNCPRSQVWTGILNHNRSGRQSRHTQDWHNTHCISDIRDINILLWTLPSRDFERMWWFLMSFPFAV